MPIEFYYSIGQPSIPNKFPKFNYSLSFMPIKFYYSIPSTIDSKQNSIIKIPSPLFAYYLLARSEHSIQTWNY